MPIPINNHVFISVDEDSNKQIKFNNGIIYFNPDYNKQKNGIIKGVVKHIPDKKCWDSEDIDFKLKVGYTVYFHYNVVLNKENRVEVEGEVLYKLRYDLTFAYVAPQGEGIDIFGDVFTFGGGGLYMLANWCIIQPIYIGSFISKRIIDPYAKERKDSHKGIVVELPIKKGGMHSFTVDGVTRQYWTSEELKKGSLIYFDKNADWELEIEGERYFVMKTEDILAVDKIDAN